MQIVLAALLVTSPFITYAPSGAPLPRTEAVIDRGPILELIVQCRKGTGILSYSKLERLYCGPKGNCSRNRDLAISRLCS